MIQYLRFLWIRTVRVHLSTGLALPIALAAVLLLLLLLDPQSSDRAAEGFLLMCGAALVIAVLTSANLTAFLIAEERRRGGSRLLRLAGIDGGTVVVAHLLHATAVGAAGVLVVTLAPGIHGLASGMPGALWPTVGLFVTLCASLGGVLGLWLGYLLPRVVAVLAVQLAGFWVSAVLASTIVDRPEVVGGRPDAFGLPLEPLAAVAAAHILTLTVLPLLWRRTSGSLW